MLDIDFHQVVAGLFGVTVLLAMLIFAYKSGYQRACDIRSDTITGLLNVQKELVGLLDQHDRLLNEIGHHTVEAAAEELAAKEAAPNLLVALKGLTKMGETPDGSIIVGPHGWQLAQLAILEVEGRI